MSQQYNTIYDFSLRNSVQVLLNPNDLVYDCYINFKTGDKSWGRGSNIFEAIEKGVINYLRFYSQRGVTSPMIANNLPPEMPHIPPMTDPTLQNRENFRHEELHKFFCKEGFIFWYWFAVKYKNNKFIDHFENLALTESPIYLSSMRFLVKTVTETIENINTKLYNEFPAIHNVFIQAIVYYESLEQTRYENNKIIMDLISKVDPVEKDAFNRLQKEIQRIDLEIQKPEQ